jgi:serine phosphatase RsbU (regulator of sigma subunit)
VCAQELSQKCDDELSYGREERIADIIHLCYCGEGPSVERHEATATGLGLFPDWVCSLAEVQLAPGDVLGIYPDGITEATNEIKRNSAMHGFSKSCAAVAAFLPRRLCEVRNDL